MAAEPKPRPSNEDRIRAALWFATRGFGIFPVWSTKDGACRCPAGSACGSPGKHPLTVNGFKDATTDPVKIRTFLSAASHPNYGMLPPEGVFIWDIDTDEERAQLARLEVIYGPLPATLHDKTANGEHVFLRWPDGLPRPLRRIWFVTRWGSGSQTGYVIGPRSVHASGAEYEPAGGTFDIATLPVAWAQAAIGADTTTVSVSGRPEPSDVPVGHRHDWLRDTARLYAGTVRDPDALFAAVWQANEKLSEPKTEEDVRRAIGDVLERFPADEVEEDPETGQVRRVPNDDVGMVGGEAEVGTFPAPPDARAFGGTIGEATWALAADSDADPIGILGSLIAFCGALIPGMTYSRRVQTSSPFIALVGKTGEGRKGTAMMRAQDGLGDAFGAVTVARVVLDGVNSGEGLVSALEYRQTQYQHEPTVGLIFEEEFVSLIASRSREGSRLDPALRAAFDGGPLSNRRSDMKASKSVKPPYWLPAVVGISPKELRKRLEPEARDSGSANRWLYLPVKRQETDPEDDVMPTLPVDIKRDLQAARKRALEISTAGMLEAMLPVAPGVNRLLARYRQHVAEHSTDATIDLTQRLPMIALRIGLVHAMADSSSEVTEEHVGRGIALTEYGRAGLDWVFGGTVGDRYANLLLRYLRKVKVMTKRMIEREVARDTAKRQDAMDALIDMGYAKLVVIHETGGRPREELRLAQGAGTFTPFSHYTDNAPRLKTEVTEQNGTNSTNGQGRAMDDAGTNLGRTGTNEAAWASPCADYEAHRSSHRRVGGQWMCDACNP